MSPNILKQEIWYKQIRGTKEKRIEHCLTTPSTQLTHLNSLDEHS